MSLGTARIDLEEVEPFRGLEKIVPLNHDKHGNKRWIRVYLKFQPEIIVKSRAKTSTFFSAGRAMSQERPRHPRQVAIEPQPFAAFQIVTAVLAVRILSFSPSPIPENEDDGFTKTGGHEFNDPHYWKLDVTLVRQYSSQNKE